MPLELRELIIIAEVGDDASGPGPEAERPEAAARRHERLVREVAERVLETLARQQED